VEVLIMIWVIDDSDIETKETIEKYAKRIGYKIVDEKEFKTKDFHQIKFKLEKRKVGQPKKNLSKDEIIALREKGNSVKEICKVLGVSRSTIYNYLGKDYPKKQ